MNGTKNCPLTDGAADSDQELGLSVIPSSAPRNCPESDDIATAGPRGAYIQSQPTVTVEADHHER
jgi:hypothetical protein